MSTQLKECLQCGSAFEGRSNQIYCSKSCKQEAFYERKEIEGIREDEKEVNSEQTIQPSDDVRTLELELKLRMIELEHEREMFKLESQTSTSEQLETIEFLREEVNDLKRSLQQANTINEKLEDDTFEVAELPAKLEQEVYELFSMWLDHLEEEWDLEELQDLSTSCTNLIQRLHTWSKKYKIDISDIEELPLIENIQLACKRGTKYIQKYKTGIFSSKTIKPVFGREEAEALQLYLDELSPLNDEDDE